MTRITHQAHGDGGRSKGDNESVKRNEKRMGRWIRNGKKTRIFDDRWVEEGQLKRKQKSGANYQQENYTFKYVS